MADAVLALRTGRKRLDMSNDQAIRQASTPAPPTVARTDGMVARIVIADDDPEVLDLLSDVLRHPAVEISKAASGAELLVLLAEQGPFDLVVTDIGMPWMEGTAVVRSARAAEIKAPVLFVSGISHPDLPAIVERLGNAKLLRKPITLSALRQAVNEMLGGVW
jgi:CheY-like chemotaxis protein